MPSTNQIGRLPPLFCNQSVLEDESQEQETLTPTLLSQSMFAGIGELVVNRLTREVAGWQDVG